MTHADFHTAILNDPDDDLTRMVFADWLDDVGEPERAEFVRLGVLCDRSRASPIGSAAYLEGRNLGRATEEAFARAWPAHFRFTRREANIGHQSGLAVVHLFVNFSEFSRVRWLSEALQLGWIGSIWVKGILTERHPVPADIPLHADIAPGRTEDVRTAIAYPKLIALSVDAADVNRSTAARLPHCLHLRTVTLYGTEPRHIDAALHRLAAVPQLRRLNLHGPLDIGEPVPHFPHLCRLVLYRNALTDVGVRRFAAANPNVQIGLPT